MGSPGESGEGFVTRREAAQLGGMTHSREHMRRIGDHPNRGRKPYPTLEQASADPRIARRLREISREFRSATER